MLCLEALPVSMMTGGFLLRFYNRHSPSLPCRDGGGSLYKHADGLPGKIVDGSQCMDRRLNFHDDTNGESMSLDIPHGGVVPLSRAHCGQDPLNGRTIKHSANGVSGSMIMAVHVMNDYHNKTSRVAWSVNAAEKWTLPKDFEPTPFCSHTELNDEEDAALYAKLSEDQKKTFDAIYKHCFVEGSISLLLELVQTGFTVMVYPWNNDKLHEELTWLIQEYKVFVDVMKPGGLCSVKRWSSGGPESYFRTLDGMMQCEEISSYLTFLCNVIPGGIITKPFMIYYD